jgi:translation initiation factor IF-3
MNHETNKEIRAKEVRLIGENGDQLGIVTIREALQIATDASLDLVNVAPTAVPPVCRILDYGKFRYEAQKKDKEARKNRVVIETKEIKMTPMINEHDYQTKMRSILKFLSNGDKVKASIRFRGREIVHSEIGKKILDRVAKEIEQVGIVERVPKFEGKSMIMILCAKAS